MEAMVLKQLCTPLIHESVPSPIPNEHELLIRIEACGVCRTDLHVIEGDLPSPKLPLIPGHQIVGRVLKCGSHVTDFKVGERVGVPWLGKTCGICPFCKGGKENLCDSPIFTGYQAQGGFAEECCAESAFCFPLPDKGNAVHLAPLLCAGLIGYRAYSMIDSANTIGLYGFGSSAHIVLQLAKQQGKTVYAFTRPGDTETQAFAKELGASWADGSNEAPPTSMDGAIIFASDGNLVPLALGQVTKGGSVICAGIHMSDIPSFPYSMLWGERTIKSVANLTRQDGLDFFKLLNDVSITPHVTTYPLTQANQALDDLRNGALRGSAVLVMPQYSDSGPV